MGKGLKPIIYTALFLVMILWEGCAGKREDPIVVTPSVTPTTTQQATIITNTPTYVVAPVYTQIPTEVPKKLICIDPGHQEKGNPELETVGPGSDVYKAKVTGGTVGIKTKLPEYKLTLTVSLLLREELVQRGYEVIMTRTQNDVDISNMERACIANDAFADAFIRIHANSSEKKSQGVMTICQTPMNPYNGNMYNDCKLLSQCVLDSFLAATEAVNNGVWETDTMSGINWSTVPVTIVEMGYLSDPDEDVLLSDPEYQTKIVKGIADGIDLFFLEKSNE